MKLFLTSAYPFHKHDNFAKFWLEESAKSDPFKEHTLVDNPEEADVILFTEHHPPADPYFFKVLKDPIRLKYKNKSILYHDNPKPIPLMATLSPSIEKTYYNEKTCLSAPYIARQIENEAISSVEKEIIPKKYLYSFLGASRTHPIRHEILKLKHPESFLEDTSDKDLWILTPDERRAYENQFADISKESLFVLCPRGVGVNSYRLYEVMQMGITPVIISDEWVPVDGPDWDSFSIRINENQIKEIPSILEARKKDALRMGKIARLTWEKYFSKDVSFHYIANLAEQLMHTKSNSKLGYLRYGYSQFLRSFHFRNLLRFYKKKYIK